MSKINLDDIISKAQIRTKSWKHCRFDYEEGSVYEFHLGNGFIPISTNNFDSPREAESVANYIQSASPEFIRDIATRFQEAISCLQKIASCDVEHVFDKNGDLVESRDRRAMAKAFLDDLSKYLSVDSYEYRN